MRFTPKKITILIVGMVLTAGLAVSFVVPVFAGDPVPGIDISLDEIPGGRVSTKNYNSSLSNRMGVQDILLSYGVGGADINKVTDALEGSGVYEAELKSFLIAIGINEEGVQAILVKFDGLGIGSTGDTTQSAPATGIIKIKDANGGTAVSSPGAGDTAQPANGTVIEKNPPQRASEISTPDTGGALPKAAEGTIKSILPSKQAKPAPDAVDTATQKSYRRVLLQQGKVFHDTQMNIVQNIRSAAPEERKDLIDELQASRETFQTEIVSMNLSIRGNAKELREHYQAELNDVNDDGRVRLARIAVAHGKGLRMLNRFRSAMARFDHILGRLESRVEKLEAQGVPADSFFDVFVSIEEAKNMSVENEAKMEELKAKYESLLLGENAGGVAEEARAIAKELKSEIENLHIKLRDIADGIKKSIPTIGAAQTILDIPDDFAAPHTPSTDTFGRSNTDLTQRIAQSFMFSTGQTISQIKIVVQDVNFPTDGINVSLQTDSGSDSPSGSGLASASKSRQELLSAGVDNSKFTQITFNVGSNYPSLAANTQYWVVVARENENPFDNGNYYQLRNYADIYSDGQQRNLVRCDIGYVWIVAGFACNQIITVGGGGGGPIVIGGGTGLVADPPVLVVSPGAGLPGGGFGGTQVSFDIDLELWKTMRPIKDRVPVR